MNALAQMAEVPQEDPLEALLAMVSAKAADFGVEQQVDAETVQAMQRAGVYRALVPRDFGGEERPRRSSCA
jgi:hypothetical protein